MSWRPGLRWTPAAGAVLITVALVVALLAAHAGKHRREGAVLPIALTRSAPGPLPSGPPPSGPPTSGPPTSGPPPSSPPTSGPPTSGAPPTIRGATRTSCDVGMPASWAAVIATGRLDLPRAQNRPISRGPDATLLLDSTVVTAHGETVSDRLLLVDGAGRTTAIWRSPHPTTQSLLADDSAAISTGWVVFTVDRAAAGGVQTGDVMAYDRSSGATRLVGTTTDGAAPIVVGDVTYWFKSSGDPSMAPTPGTAMGLNLATHQQVQHRPETQAITFLRLGNGVVMQRGSGPLSSATLSIPSAVVKAFTDSFVQSDGSVLYAAQAHGGTLALRRWAPGATTVTTYPFVSARGLSGLAVAYPYLASTVGNPGESGYLIDLRSGLIVRLAGGLVLSSVNAGQAVFTSSTSRQLGPLVVYRVSLTALPAPHC